MEAADQAFQHRSFSIKLWPPSQSTRLLLVERMSKNLCTDSIFSRKYGLLTRDEACLDAKQIEEAGFTIANEHFLKEPDGDGSSAVQLYAKETSKRMLEVIKRGPRTKDTDEVKASEKTSTPKETFFDISGGRRDVLGAEEACELLKPLTEEGNAYSKICFSNRSFGLDAANVAGPIVSSLKHQLKHVDLSDFVAGKSEEEALNVMRVFASALEGCILKSLDLSNNALGEKGVRAFELLLKSQNDLEELYLMNNGISPEAASAVSELIPSTHKLKILHFHNNMTGDEGAFAISDILRRSPLLEDFRCSSTRVDAVGGIKLAESLGTCKYLRKIDISDNMFGVEAGTVLGKSITNFAGLAEIYLSYLNLEDEGTITVCNALKESTAPLQVLEIAGNEITIKAVPALAGCISSKLLLTKLNLSENELLDEGAVLIGNVLKQEHVYLKELDVSTNSIRRVGARYLAQAVAHNKPDFSLLNLNGNAISDEGIDEVKGILKAGTKSDSVLGPLDENDAEGEGSEGGKSEEEEDVEGGDELESKLQNLKVEK